MTTFLFFVAGLITGAGVVASLLAFRSTPLDIARGVASPNVRRALRLADTLVPTLLSRGEPGESLEAALLESVTGLAQQELQEAITRFDPRMLLDAAAGLRRG
jgi:hypothetical protein